MKIYCYTIKTNVKNASKNLERLGVEVLYSNEMPDGSKEIFGKQMVKTSFAEVKEHTLDPIDWTKQWNNFEIKIGSKVLKLNAGPGFGDLSHPTTRLVLQMMKPYIKNAHVLDIGCGSGILSIAAAALGAASVHGIDIDQAAIAHAKENAEINQLNVTFSLPEEYQVAPHRLIVLMNMISSEQEIALKSLPILKEMPCEFFISGILENETYEREWILRERKLKERWIGLHYSKLPIHIKHFSF